MITIFSGVDRVGKTTLIETLQKQTGIHTIKFKGPQKRDIPVDEWAQESLIFHRSILRYLEGMQGYDNTAVFLDRFYPDEVVYSKVLRNKNLWKDYKELDERFAALGTKYIYMEPYSMRVLKSRYNTEKLTKFEEVENLLYEYEVFFENTKLHKLCVDQFTKIPKIVNFLISRQYSQNNSRLRVI